MNTHSLSIDSEEKNANLNENEDNNEINFENTSNNNCELCFEFEETKTENKEDLSPDFIYLKKLVEEDVNDKSFGWSKAIKGNFKFYLRKTNEKNNYFEKK